MRPIESLDVVQAKRLRGLLFDLDDTFLNGTELDLDAYRTLFELRDSGLWLVAVTGRPSGWGEVLARQWPVSGVVVENGALGHARLERRTERIDTVTPAERAARRERLAAIAREVRERHPTLVPADDVRSRESDVTFDIGEYESVPDEVVRAAMSSAASLGARTVRSSVHLHLTLDGHDKASGAVAFVRRVHGLDPGAAPAQLAFIGDSENDAPCFCAFATTIAVANFRGRPTVAPRFVTRGERAAGFVEAARAIIARRH
jgi:HAD superfamily hydrolase (TIGR01484 family)